MPPNKSKVLPALVTLAIVAGGIGYLFWSSAGEAFEYYKHVDEVMSEPAKWEGKHLQLHGFVVPESIKRRMDTQHQQIEYKFLATNCGPEIEVRYAGTVPDTFKNRAEVVVKGQLANGYFQASEISAKCPSKYQTAADSPTVTMCTKGDKNVTAAAAQTKVN
ncbi:MAG TPA: cytochrome c maturation protein CcmE [Polyangia bacterium]|nr:cytochrome c maturation protein CcmE [Polyangia bacterium]